jgi:bis(5'-nucleosyl)-tetraphosphatase (symmetrical)
MSTYAIGDVQGCLKQLKKLLKEIKFNTKKDTLWFCGDLINRGPDSLETLRFIKQLGNNAVVVLGNHDLHLLAIAHGTSTCRRKDTLHPILKAPDREELLSWLIQQPLVHTDERLGYMMVHAGIPPQWTLKECLRYAKEVHHALQGPKATLFFEHMYGNEPACWEASLRGQERLRIITNYLTRLRFCDPQGCLELDYKGGPEGAPLGYQPWYAYRQAKRDGLSIVFGHWAALEGACPVKHIHALDTGCVWGGPLTAMNLETKQRHSVS